LHQFLVGYRAHGGISVGEVVAIMAAPAAFFQSIVNMIYIRVMNLNSLDLNLLVALDALLLEASVSRAAMRIGLCSRPPAMRCSGCAGCSAIPCWSVPARAWN